MKATVASNFLIILDSAVKEDENGAGTQKHNGF
jgi:hypothetical protein